MDLYVTKHRKNYSSGVYNGERAEVGEVSVRVFFFGVENWLF